MTFGTRVDERTAFDLLDRYVDAGGVWIDTADCYAFWDSPDGHGGQSEEVLGRWLDARPGVRDRVLLSSKVGAEPVRPGSFPDEIEGLARQTVESVAKQSLTRLRTDRLDLFWAHMEDRATSFDETAEGFGRLVDDGLVARVGASNHALWRVERWNVAAAHAGLTGVSALQLRYSYAQPRPFVRGHEHLHRFGWLTDESLDWAQGTPGSDLWAYTPQISGAYDRDDRALPDAYDHPGTTRRLAALTDVAHDLGVPRSQVVLAWLTGGAPSVTPIVGVSTAEQLDSALAGVRLDLSAEHRGLLDAAW
ncbi:aldo/keto reductase [Cellulosimicrobium terreum]|nr:aldo/keto reductase [Cellulosimicrobium terreum]